MPEPAPVVAPGLVVAAFSACFCRRLPAIAPAVAPTAAPVPASPVIAPIAAPPAAPLAEPFTAPPLGAFAACCWPAACGAGGGALGFDPALLLSRAIALLLVCQLLIGALRIFRIGEHPDALGWRGIGLIRGRGSLRKGCGREESDSGQ